MAHRRAVLRAKLPANRRKDVSGARRPCVSRHTRRDLQISTSRAFWCQPLLPRGHGTMCWSWQVATAFSVVEFAACVHLWYRNWCLQDRWAVPFLATILVVELMEIPMWALVEPRASLDAGSTSCPAGNTAALVVAGLAVSLQPFFTMLFAYKTCVVVPIRYGAPFCCLNWRAFRCAHRPMPPEGLPLSECRQRGKDRFLVPLFLSALVSAGMWVRLGLGTLGVGALKEFEAENPFALAGKTTCAYDGPEGHLLWVFAAVDNEFLPAMFAYFLFFNFAMAFYSPKSYGFCFVVALLPVLIIIFAAVRWSNEGWSIWCWTGLLMHWTFVGTGFLYTERGRDLLIRCLRRVRSNHRALLLERIQPPVDIISRPLRTSPAPSGPNAPSGPLDAAQPRSSASASLPDEVPPVAHHQSSQASTLGSRHRVVTVV